MEVGNGHPSQARTPAKPERPPVTKKSRTSDESQTPHFPGPLFPAVRRLSPTSSFNPSSPTAAAAASLSSSSVSVSPGGDAFSFNFSDRDYVFPSNLGPYSTRRNVTIKSPSSSSVSKSQPQKQQSASHLPVRSTSMPSSLSGASGRGISKPKLRAEKDLKTLSLQASPGLVPAPSRVSGPPDSACCRAKSCSSFRVHWKVHLLIIIFFVAASYAILLRNEVTRLQEENTKLRSSCSHENAVGSNGVEVLELQSRTSLWHSGNTDPRMIALYTVFATLLMPFILYKCLDDLPRIKNFSNRTKDCKEEVPLKKRVAYMVDVCFSVYPYAKLLALLFATLFLIGFGGLALYAVSDGSLAEALWLSWSFVADSGNHADMAGTGPRIVSVSISSGGMLIFAMMLGLVSDAISEKVSVSKARAIIVLASDENVDQSDACALRVVLSLTGVKEGLRGHIAVEMCDLDNEPLVKLVGGDLIETVVAHDVIGRLMIQCPLHPGLAQIWEGILGFEMPEFYIKRWPKLDSLCFEDVFISFPDAIPCGVKVFANGGKIKMNLDDKYVLREGDEILVIAEDDDTYALGPLPKIRKGLSPRITDPPKFPEKILFCGWRRDIDDMIMVLEAFLAPGSELWTFNEVPEKVREALLTDGGLNISGLVNLKLVHRKGNAVI